MSKFLNHVDLNGNELRLAVIQNLGSVPTTNAKPGGIYFDTNGGANVLKYHNGTEWLTITTGASNTWQPYDADLSAIAALTGTSGFLKTNGSGTWSVDTATYLTSSTGVTSVNASVGAVTGVAVTATGLSQFASTTSAELATVLSDETGYSTGAKAVFSISPTISTSIVTGSSSFDLVNTTATTVNIAGAASAVNIGNASGSVTIAGNLIVNGTTTTINSTTLSVDDKNIILADGNSLDSGADGGGITLSGATNKTFNWVDSTDAWTSSEHMDLASGKAYYINGTQVLSGSTLGSGVTSSSLTTVGTIGTGVWQGTAVAIAYGGTGASTAALARTNLEVPSRYATSIGNGASTTYTVTHNLGTLDVVVAVYTNSDGSVVYPDVTNATTNTVTIDFASAPTTNQYRVVVIG